MTFIKAIETRFDGHVFRSRLEARWAVFFKEMGLKYEYEPEGFELKQRVKYLPDFLLPSQALYVEVKPNRDLKLEDIRKLALFSADGDQALLLIVGTPGEHEMFFLDRSCVSSWEETQDSIREFGTDVFFENLSRVTFDGIPGKSGWHVVYTHSQPYADCTRQMAFHAARAARFEHGRSGN